jgi:hypothetical protein
MIEADEDVDIKAGRSINLSSGSGRILLKGNKVDASGLTGNVIEAVGGGFGVSSFLGSFVGADIIGSVFNAAIPPEIGSALSTAATSATGALGSFGETVANSATGALGSFGETVTENLQGGSILEGNTTTSFELL